MIIKTYERFFFRKKDIEKANGKLEDIPIPPSNILEKVKNFFEKTSYSDFNYIVQEITDEYGSYDIEYTFKCEFGNFKLSEIEDKFHIEGIEWLAGMSKKSLGDQNYVIDRVGKYAILEANLKGFKFDEDDPKREFVVDVAERLKDMCGFDYFVVGTQMKPSPYEKQIIQPTINFAF